MYDHVQNDKIVPAVLKITAALISYFFLGLPDWGLWELIDRWKQEIIGSQYITCISPTMLWELRNL